jgi:hypothetical protein
MKIALATTSLSRFGGAASYQDHLAYQLLTLGHTVTQYRIGHVDAKKGDIICVEKSVIKGPDKQFTAPESLYCPWSELWERHDVVHITNPGALHLGFFDPAKLFKKHGPLVLTIHDPHEIEVLGPTLIGLCELADIVTFIGKRYMDSFCAAGYAKGMTSKAWHLIQPYNRANKKRARWAKQRRIICTSPWRPVKRINLVVEAAGFLPLTGEEAVKPLELWSGDGIDYVEDMVEALPGYAHCDDKGAWEPEQQFEVYGSAAVLVNMTFFDSSDTGRTEYPILEAWDYHLTPVLPSDFVGLPNRSETRENEFRHGYNCVIVEPQPFAIAAGIVQALTGKPGIPPHIFDGCLEDHTRVGKNYVEAYEEAIRG